MAKTQFNVEQIKTEAVKPLYAVAGAYEVAYELWRGYAADAQKAATERFQDVQQRVSKIEREPKAFQDQAIALFSERVEELQKEAKEAQSKFEARVAELQKDAKAFPASSEGRQGVPREASGPDRRGPCRADQDLRVARRAWREADRGDPQGRRQGRHRPAQGPGRGNRCATARLPRARPARLLPPRPPRRRLRAASRSRPPRRPSSRAVPRVAPPPRRRPRPRPPRRPPRRLPDQTLGTDG